MRDNWLRPVLITYFQTLSLLVLSNAFATAEPKPDCEWLLRAEQRETWGKTHPHLNHVSGVDEETAPLDDIAPNPDRGALLSFYALSVPRKTFPRKLRSMRFPGGHVANFGSGPDVLNLMKAFPTAKHFHLYDIIDHYTGLRYDIVREIVAQLRWV